jgi:hypothetical protein
VSDTEGTPAEPQDAIVVALVLFQSKLREAGLWTPSCERTLHDALTEMQRVDTEGSEWDAQLCLTAFDVLWTYVPADVLATAEEEMDDNSREVLQRAVEMSAARRLAEGML